MSAMPFAPREEKIVIGEVTYKIRELLASERSILLFRTQELLGGSLDSIITGYQADQEILLIIGGVVKEIIKRMTQNSTPQQLNAFIKDTIIASVISPQAASEDTAAGYEIHFCQYYDHMIPLLSAIYKQNFGVLVNALKKKLYDSGWLMQPSSEQETEEKSPKTKPQMNVKTGGLQNINFSNGT